MLDCRARHKSPTKPTAAKQTWKESRKWSLKQKRLPAGVRHYFYLATRPFSLEPGVKEEKTLSLRFVYFNNMAGRELGLSEISLRKDKRDNRELAFSKYAIDCSGGSEEEFTRTTVTPLLGLVSELWWNLLPRISSSPGSLFLKHLPKCKQTLKQ